jgi:hypothetical protein
MISSAATDFVRSYHYFKTASSTYVQRRGELESSATVATYISAVDILSTPTAIGCTLPSAKMAWSEHKCAWHSRDNTTCTTTETINITG